jgi:hypothetical protein
MRNDKGDRWQHTWPAYTDGEWVPSHAGRRSITDSVAMTCDAQDFCPLGTCADGAFKAAGVCSHSHDLCFKDRTSKTFALNTCAGTRRTRPCRRFIERDADPFPALARQAVPAVDVAAGEWLPLLASDLCHLTGAVR